MATYVVLPTITAPGPAALLEAGGGVHGVAGDDPIAFVGSPSEIDQDLAGLDADTQGELGSALGPQLGRELGHRGLHLERGADGSFGIVLVDGRHAEDGQHRVAGELLDEAFVARDLDAQPVEHPADERLDVLRVETLVEAREADDVGEDDRRDLPFA